MFPAEDAAEDHQDARWQVVVAGVAQSSSLQAPQGCLELGSLVSSVARLHGFPEEIGLGPTILTNKVFHKQKSSPLHSRLHAASSSDGMDP